MTTAPAADVAALRRQYVKFCDVRDFDQELVERIREIVPSVVPPAAIHRKYWEYAMLTLYLEDSGKLHDDAEVLATGAGREEVLFWLANKVGRVVATDIYGEGAFADREGDLSMLDDPAACAPFPYREERLEVRRMDARSLGFPDSSFDAVFSLSAIEHFGTVFDVARAAREVGRVLKPGGVAYLATECFVKRHPLNSRLVHTLIRLGTRGRRCGTASPVRRAVDVFTVEDLRVLVVRPSGLRLSQPYDWTMSPETWQNITYWADDGSLTTATGERWPHILLQAHGSPWTSFGLALVKDPAPAEA